LKLASEIWSQFNVAGVSEQCDMCLIGACFCDAAERDYDMQFWKEELVREINELEKSAAELQVNTPSIDSLRGLFTI